MRTSTTILAVGVVEAEDRDGEDAEPKEETDMVANDRDAVLWGERGAEASMAIGSVGGEWKEVMVVCCVL